jgi:hypothetical protein
MAGQCSSPNPKMVRQPPGHQREAGHSRIECREEQPDLGAGKVEVLLVERGEGIDPILRGCRGNVGGADEGKYDPAETFW